MYTGTASKPCSLGKSHAAHVTSFRGLPWQVGNVGVTGLIGKPKGKTTRSRVPIFETQTCRPAEMLKLAIIDALDLTLRPPPATDRTSDMDWLHGWLVPSTQPTSIHRRISLFGQERFRGCYRSGWLANHPFNSD